jgi:hypothetical protein
MVGVRFWLVAVQRVLVLLVVFTGFIDFPVFGGRMAVRALFTCPPRVIGFRGAWDRVAKQHRGNYRYGDDEFDSMAPVHAHILALARAVALTHHPLARGTGSKDPKPVPLDPSGGMCNYSTK